MIADAYDGHVDSGGTERALTQEESEFLRLLCNSRPWLDVWRRQDGDGTPWLIVSLDFSRKNQIVRTLRLDFDGDSVKGGWSPAALNWDSEVRADDAEVDYVGRDGLVRTGETAELAMAASRWFDAHRANRTNRS